ncbi:hypothetical protein AX289_00175 [Methylorubrum populi]|nr:hypothetical protein AX289_00175 [Methylorubrum populi]
MVQVRSTEVEAITITELDGRAVIGTRDETGDVYARGALTGATDAHVGAALLIGGEAPRGVRIRLQDAREVFEVEPCGDGSIREKDTNDLAAIRVGGEGQFIAFHG